jgi:hypothetical protein
MYDLFNRICLTLTYGPSKFRAVYSFAFGAVIVELQQRQVNRSSKQSSVKRSSENRCQQAWTSRVSGESCLSHSRRSTHMFVISTGE